MKLLPIIALSAAIIGMGAGCVRTPPTTTAIPKPTATSSCRKADAWAESCDFQGLLGAGRRKEPPREGTEKLPRGVHPQRRRIILSGTPRV